MNGQLAIERCPADVCHCRLLPALAAECVATAHDTEWSGWEWQQMLIDIGHLDVRRCQNDSSGVGLAWITCRECAGGWKLEFATDRVHLTAAELFVA